MPGLPELEVVAWPTDPSCTSRVPRQDRGSSAALGPQVAGPPRAVASSGLGAPRPRQPSAMALGLFQVSSYVCTVGTEAQEELVRIVGVMCRKLKAERYHSSYFDRGAEAGSRLCTADGWFSCQVSGAGAGVPHVGSARGSPASVAPEPPDGAGKDLPPPGPQLLSRAF